MRRVVTDKIASVAQSCGLTPELRLSGEVPCEEGVVLAVEILNDKYTYNELAGVGALGLRSQHPPGRRLSSWRHRAPTV